MTERRYITLKISQKTSQSIKIKSKKIQGFISYRKKYKQKAEGGLYLTFAHTKWVNRIIIEKKIIIIVFRIDSKIVFKNTKSFINRNSKTIIFKCTFLSSENCILVLI